MNLEKIELFKTSNETPVVDTEKDKQEILKNIEQELASKKQELADLDSGIGYVLTEELAAKKSQLNDEIMGIESQKSTLVQEAAPSQAEIEVAQPIKPETPTDDFKTTIETDPDFLKKKFAEQGVGTEPIKAEQISSDLEQTTEPEKTIKEKLNELGEKTNQDLGDIGKEYNAKIADAKAQSQVEQPVGQFETPDQLREEMEKNAEQVKKMTVETAPDKLESSKEAVIEKKSVLIELFSNPEADKRIQEIKTELNTEKEEIQALEEAIAEKKQKVKSLEGEMNKLEQDSLVAFFRNAPKIETANKRGASAVARGMAISELRAALDKYDKTQDQGFLEKVMKKLSAKMKKLFKQAYPDLFPKKEKAEKAKKPAKAKKAVGNQGLYEGAEVF